MIWGRVLGGAEEEVESKAGFGVTGVFGVLNAPVDARCRRSNSSCSLGGRRGGEGPTEKAGLRVECVKNRWDGRRNLGGRSRDIVLTAFNEVL